MAKTRRKFCLRKLMDALISSHQEIKDLKISRDMSTICNWQWWTRTYCWNKSYQTSDDTAKKFYHTVHYTTIKWKMRALGFVSEVHIFKSRSRIESNTPFHIVQCDLYCICPRASTVRYYSYLKFLFRTTWEMY